MKIFEKIMLQIGTYSKLSIMKMLFNSNDTILHFAKEILLSNISITSGNMLLL